ncbi:serine protease inhibitor swm-1-like [Chironomus tepperi]|uniref:serine protease inhibitor swm-1-like n=1 Tax=Chironomus tepperi TaxID=113505 RepID=UPI00391F5A37
MNFFILCLVCGTLANEISINGIIPQSESIVDVPKDALGGDPNLFQEETTVAVIPDIQGRQDEDYDAVVEESEVSTTENLATQGCNKANEYYNACGPRCQQTCSFQQRISGGNTRAICESIFSGSCHPGCYCQDGYVRFNDKCIKPVECPTRLCLGNEEYRTNGSPCQLTCDSYPQAEAIEAKCPKDIPISGCFCKHGYVRSATGSCILPNRCPRPLVS